MDAKQPKRFLHVIKTALIYYREMLILNRYGHEEIQIFYTQKYSTYIPNEHVFDDDTGRKTIKDSEFFLKILS